MGFPLPLPWDPEPGALAARSTASALLFAALFVLYRPAYADFPVGVRVWNARVDCGRWCGGTLASEGDLECVEYLGCLRTKKIVVSGHLRLGPVSQNPH